MTLSSNALAFSIQSLLSSNYNGVPTSPRRDIIRHFSCSTESGGSLSPTCSDASITALHDSDGAGLHDRDPKTPKSEDGGNEFEVGDSSPEELDQNGKKPRTIFSRDQVQKLEDAYQTKRYLTRRERKELASDAEISHTQVKIWFQNRRAKAKLKDRRAMALMQSAISSQRHQLYNHLPSVGRLPCHLPPVGHLLPNTDHHILPPRPNNLIAPIPTKLPSIRPLHGQSAFNWFL